jgi:hypothetical protein
VDNLGYHDAYTAIVNRIKPGGLASNCAATMRWLAMSNTSLHWRRRHDQQRLLLRDGAARQFRPLLFGFRQLQHFVPSRGWLQSTGW